MMQSDIGSRQRNLTSLLTSAYRVRSVCFAEEVIEPACWVVGNTPSDTFVHRNVSSFPIVWDYVQYQALNAVQNEDSLCSCPCQYLGNAGTGSR
jgi:hypothetical protein